MNEDGHKYFFGQMPEMPWKRKEREMDNKFKELLLRCLVTIIFILMFGGKNALLNSSESIHKLNEDIDDYIGKLG